MLEVQVFQRFQSVLCTNASLGPAMRFTAEVMYSWRQANLRMGENGQPGASEILESLRNRIAAVV